MIRRVTALALPPGLYLVLWADGGRSTAAVYMDQRGDRWLAPTNWVGPGRVADHVEQIEALRPLARMGGISGAMYWGDEIR